MGLRGVSGTPFSSCQDSGDGKDCETAVVWWDLGESLGLPLVHARIHGMGRTVGQQWYGETEMSLWDSLQSPPGIMGWEGPSVPIRNHGMGKTVGQHWYGGTEKSPWDSLQSLPGLRGWEGLWDSSGMVGLRGVTGTPFSPGQDSGDRKDCGTAVVW